MGAVDSPSECDWPQPPEAAVPLCRGKTVREDRTAGAGQARTVDSQSWGKSLLSDLNRLMFYCSSLRKRELGAARGQSLLDSGSKWKSVPFVPPLWTLRKQRMTISTHKHGSALENKWYSWGEDKERTCISFPAKRRRIIFFRSRQHFPQFLSVDSHLTPGQRMPWDENLKKPNLLKKHYLKKFLSILAFLR